MPKLQPEYLDSRTPSDVVVTDTVRGRIEDPRLGVPLATDAPGAPPVPANPKHGLVTIGDSLTHGMSNAAVYDTDRSWPALVAAGLGLTDFTVPRYGGPLHGLPLNIEEILRQLEARFGDDLNLLENLSLPLVLREIVDRNEDYWERGEGSRPPRTDRRYENLGIYGWDVRDSLSYTAARAATRASVKVADDFLGARPDHDNDIAAGSVLAPFGVDATQVRAASWFGRDGGIDTLVVALGANNALRSVVDKASVWSAEGFGDLERKAAFNVWRPSHFAIEYAELVRSLSAIPARRVILGTVPHVTIAPIARGVNPRKPGRKWREGSRYFPYYTDPWIDDESFNPGKHRHLTHQQARAIDSAIDQYNDTILDAVRHARGEGRDWLVLDLCGLLDGLAHRRFATDRAAAAGNDWRGYELPAAIAHLDSRFFRSGKDGRTQGGLFGLDGVHPTTAGYGIIAKEVLDILAAEGVTTKPVDFAALLAKDTLNARPPALLEQLLTMLGPFLTTFVSCRLRLLPFDL
jgi:hypothetical protein